MQFDLGGKKVLITAVAAGIVLASLLFVKRMADLQLANINIFTRENLGEALSTEERAILEANERIVLYHLNGPFGFGAARGMVWRMAAADAFEALILDLTDVPFIDSSAGLAIEDAIRQAQSGGRKVFIAGLAPEVENNLARLGVLDLLSPERVHATRVAALETARDSLKQNSTAGGRR